MRGEAGRRGSVSPAPQRNSPRVFHPLYFCEPSQGSWPQPLQNQHSGDPLSSIFDTRSETCGSRCHNCPSPSTRATSPVHWRAHPLGPSPRHAHAPPTPDAQTQPSRRDQPPPRRRPSPPKPTLRPSGPAVTKLNPPAGHLAPPLPNSTHPPGLYYTHLLLMAPGTDLQSVISLLLLVDEL